MTNEELQKEVQRLRAKLSPLEDKNFTAKLRKLLDLHDLMPYRRNFRKGDYIVITPAKLANDLFLPMDKYTITNIGRSLAALCWERSALNGTLIFVKPIAEYLEEK